MGRFLYKTLLVLGAIGIAFLVGYAFLYIAVLYYGIKAAFSSSD